MVEKMVCAETFAFCGISDYLQHSPQAFALNMAKRKRSTWTEWVSEREGEREREHIRLPAASYRSKLALNSFRKLYRLAAVFSIKCSITRIDLKVLPTHILHITQIILNVAQFIVIRVDQHEHISYQIWIGREREITYWVFNSFN